MLLNARRMLWLTFSAFVFLFIIFNSIAVIKSTDGASAVEIHRDTDNNPLVQKRLQIMAKGALSPEDVAEIDRLWLEILEDIKKGQAEMHAQHRAHRANLLAQPKLISIATASLLWMVFLFWIRPETKEMVIPQALAFIILLSSPATMYELLAITILNFAFIILRLKAPKAS